MFIDDATRLRHMRDAARDALRIAAGRERSELDSDRMLALSLVKSIEIIGEAASQVSAAYREAHGGIAWPQLIGMRHRLTHAYYDIDADIVWNTVQADLPPLLIELDRLIAEHKL